MRTESPVSESLVAEPQEVSEDCIHHFFYLSSASRMLAASELEAILEVSRRNNAAAGVTGMLIHHEGTFIQYLEGPHDAVVATERRIRRDRRHSGVLTLSQGTDGRRLFDGWSMGFANAPQLDAQADAAGGAFDLSWHELDRRVPEGFPDLIRTMMRQVYTSSR